ncbi:expressed unknown protein [Seminavis robusta]|uniref:Uncharacterized protein n=1 Tax=Seminavis robusta TaxID=568900 RepID=A0A9N8HLL5_9STRA|nr:expressed unknown protein [Seminavis robusta]|eukprot:Sro692_g187970.1 n/a (163) ;mRNA; f:4822-5310
MTALRSVAASFLLSAVSVLSDSVCLILQVHEFSPVMTSILTNCTGTTCSVDFADFPASEGLEMTCSNLTGAIFQTYDESSICSGKTLTAEYITLTAKNIPYCSTQKCDANELKKAKDEVVKGINMVYSDVGIDCSVSVSGAALAQGFMLSLMAVMGLAVYFG